jgi:aerobic carbon-monoxide dehydrogenase medium subunit
MIPPAFDYALPKTLDEAIGLLGQHPQAKILAGGHSLIPMMKFRLAAPAFLVDINQLSDLAYIREEGDWLKIGAMTREVDLERSAVVRDHYPLLSDTARSIADPIVRNVATVGGNLAHADPANDHPATMLAYGAEVDIAGPGGRRTVPIAAFFTGPFTTTLDQNEILTEIRIPARQAGDGGCYQKVERKVGDFATVAVAAQVHLDPSGVCTYAGIGLTNSGLTPIKCTRAETGLLGKALDDAAIAEAAQLTAQAASPTSDYRGSEAYKRSLTRTLTTRALRAARERAKAG